MPAYKKDLEKVKELRETQSALAKRAGELGASAKSFQANVMDKVREARAARGVSQLNLDIGTAMGRMATEPAAIRQRMEGAGPRVSPMQVDVATAAQRGRHLGTLGTLAGYQQDISGTIQDVIGAGTNRLKTMAAMRQAEAQQKATEAANLMQQVQFQATQEQQAFENMMALKEYELAKRKARQPEKEGRLTPNQMLKWMTEAGELSSEVENVTGKKNYVLNKVSGAIYLLENDIVQVGPTAGRLLPLKATVLGDKYASDFYRTVQELATKKMFEYGGKVLPAQEIERLEPFLPSNLTQSKTKILGDLRKLRDELEQGYNEQINKAQSQLYPITTFLSEGEGAWVSTGNVKE